MEYWNVGIMSMNTLRILIVDDNKDQQVLMKEAICKGKIYRYRLWYCEGKY